MLFSVPAADAGVATLTVTRTIKGHSRPVNGLVVSNDGSVVISTADDGKVIRWSNALTAAAGAHFTGTQDVLLYAAAAENSGAGGEEDVVVAVANDDLVKINTKTSEVKKLTSHSGGAVAVASVSKSNVIAVLQKSALTLYKASTGEKLKQYTSAAGGDASLAIGKECGALASLKGSDLLAVGFEKQVKVFTVAATGDLTFVASYAGVHSAAAGGNVTALAFSADGTLVASGDSNRQLAVWNTTASAEVVRDNMCFHASRVTSLAFSPNDKNVLVSGGLDGALIAWDLSNGNAGKKIVHDAAHRGGVTRVAFASAEKEVISAGADACIKRWTFSF